MEIAQNNIDLACKTGDHVPFIHAMFLVFRNMPVEMVFSICLSEVETCLQIPQMELPQKDLQNRLSLLRGLSPDFHLEPPDYQPIDLSPYKDKYVVRLIKAINNLLEPTTKTDIHWQGALLENAFHQMTIYRIVNYRVTNFPNSEHTETWNEPAVIEFRKSIFKDFKQKYMK